MLALFLLLALLLVLVGHAFRLLRWEQFIRIYERPPRGQMLRGMAGGYALNFVLPFHLGDAFRAVYTGRRMKSGIGFALATVIMDRFLDVWFVAFGFIAFRLLGLGGAKIAGAESNGRVFIKPRSGGECERPAGEWNCAEIVCVGDHIAVCVNGVLQNECTGSVRSGYIALQSEGGPVEFRNIWLTRLRRGI